MDDVNEKVVGMVDEARRDQIWELATRDYKHPKVVDQVVGAAPGWRVVVEARPDEDGDGGCLMIRSVAAWLMHDGAARPLYLDSIGILVAAAHDEGERIVAILPPGHKPLEVGVEACTDERPIERALRYAREPRAAAE